MWIQDATQKRIIARRVRIAKNFFQRLLGLIGTSRLEDDTALWIPKCQGVHTFGMRYAIDILFLDESKTILEVAANMTPNHFGNVVWKAMSVLEFPAGSVKKMNIHRGDRLRFLKMEKAGCAMM